MTAGFINFNFNRTFKYPKIYLQNMYLYFSNITSRTTLADFCSLEVLCELFCVTPMIANTPSCIEHTQSDKISLPYHPIQINIS